jgi:hypothetical protein
MKQTLNQIRNNNLEDQQSADQISQLQRQLEKANSERISIEQSF